MGRASIGGRLAAAALCACLAAMGVPAAALAQDGPAPGEGALAANAPAEDASAVGEGAPQPGSVAPREVENGLETQLEVTFDGDDGTGAAMKSAIDAALVKLPAGKSKGDVTDIVVIGAATEIAGGDWAALKGCYTTNGEWTSLSGLDLSGMSGLSEVSGADGGNAAFGELARVELPDTLDSIGDYAFSGCSKLNFGFYGLPQDLSSIGESAFSGCTSLALQGLPNGVDSIGAGAFSGCTSLDLEFLPEGVTSIGDRTFQGCTNLALHSLYEGVDFIGESAFEGCASLVLGRLPDSIKAIGESAFSGCEKLDFSEIPANTSIVEPMTFSGCKNIEKMSFPVDLKFVGESAFEGCTSLKELSFRGVDLPKLDANAFKDVAQGGTVYCPDAKTYEYEDSFVANGPSGWRYESFYTLEVAFDGDVTMEKAIDAALARVGKGKIGAKGIKVAGAATEITGGDWGKLKRCYQRDSEWANLSGLDLSGMGELTAVSGFDDRSIDPYYDRLVDLKLPDGLGSIGSYAFLNCYSLVLDELPSSLETVGQNAFQSCTGLALDKLPSGLTSIGADAFQDCTSLALEELPVGVEDVPDRAFQGCISLALAKLPANLSSIGRDAFAGCEKLALSALPAKVSSVGSSAFSKCEGLEAMALPSALRSIDKYAFEGCTSLAELEFHGPAPSLGEGAFEGVPTHGALYALEDEGYVKGDFGGADLAGWDFFTMARRTLVDAGTGVKVTGVFSPSAALLVEEGGLHLEDACAACNAMREREAEGEVLGEYSVSLASGRLWGGVEASFPTGTAYDGRTVAVLHCAGGVLEAVDVTVSAGYATGAFSSLSPFAVVAPKDVPTPLPTPKSDDMAKTGDGPGAAPWLALASIAFLVAALAVVRRRSVRR